MKKKKINKNKINEYVLAELGDELIKEKLELEEKLLLLKNRKKKINKKIKLKGVKDIKTHTRLVEFLDGINDLDIKNTNIKYKEILKKIKNENEK
jgi:hypothetical protein